MAATIRDVVVRVKLESLRSTSGLEDEGRRVKEQVRAATAGTKNRMVEEKRVVDLALRRERDELRHHERLARLRIDTETKVNALRARGQAVGGRGPAAASGGDPTGGIFGGLGVAGRFLGAFGTAYAITKAAQATPGAMRELAAGAHGGGGWVFDRQQDAQRGLSSLLTSIHGLLGNRQEYERRLALDQARNTQPTAMIGPASIRQLSQGPMGEHAFRGEDAMKDRVRMLRAESAALQEQAQAQRAALTTRQQLVAGLLQEIQGYRAAARGAEVRLEDQKAEFGRLDPFTQKQLAGIAAKWNAGTATDEELAFAASQSSMFAGMERSRAIARAERSGVGGIATATQADADILHFREMERAKKDEAAAKLNAEQEQRRAQRFVDGGKLQAAVEIDPVNIEMSVKHEERLVAKLEEAIQKNDDRIKRLINDAVARAEGRMNAQHH